MASISRARLPIYARRGVEFITNCFSRSNYSGNPGGWGPPAPITLSVGIPDELEEVYLGAPSTSRVSLYLFQRLAYLLLH